MSKSTRRVLRDRQLSRDEITRDKVIRRQVQIEFTPTPNGSRAFGALSQTIRNAIRVSGKPVEQIAIDAGVSQAVIARFDSGERDIRTATADKLGEALGLQLALAS